MPLLRRVPFRWFVLAACALAWPALASEYNASDCAQVEGTLNIHWRYLGAGGCTGIEFTDGTFAEARTGSIVMSGVGVSNNTCIGTDNYTFQVAGGGSALTGFASAVPMVLVREPGERCFVGHWTLGSSDYLAHIAAAPFVGSPIPTLGPASLASLAGALALAAWIVRRGRQRPRMNSRSSSGSVS